MLKFLRRDRQPERAFGEAATEEDIVYCYRLLLRREPEPDGLAFYRREFIERGQPYTALVHSFLQSAEFLQLNRDKFAAAVLASASQIRLIQLPEFQIFLRLSDPHIARGMVESQTYEHHVTAAIRPYLKPGITVLDIGANVGYFTLLAARALAGQGRIVAFEPNRFNCELIRLSLAQNGITNVTLHERAVSDRAGTLLLLPDGSNGRLLTNEQPTAAPNADEREWLDQHPLLVETVALDDLLGDLDRVDLVKIDIEGAEPMALRGMAGLIRRHRPVIFTELSPVLLEATAQTAPDAYLQQLRDLGYTLRVIDYEIPRLLDLPDFAAMEGWLARWKQDHLDILALPA